MRCDVRAAVAQIEIQEKYGARYEGQVNQDSESGQTLKHGKGVYSQPDGYRYEGEHRNASEHGHGTRTYRDGRVVSGEFDDDEFLGDDSSDDEFLGDDSSDDEFLGSG